MIWPPQEGGIENFWHIFDLVEPTPPLGGVHLRYIHFPAKTAA